MTAAYYHLAVPVDCIVSGGQTGADRGAFEAADDLGMESRGWAPSGFRAEDGRIPEHFRSRMTEHRSAGYNGRTEANVVDSDGALVLSFGPLRPGGGSALTMKIARRHRRSSLHVVIPADGALAGVGLDRSRAWIRDGGVRILNVAGPRESVEPGLQRAVRRALAVILVDAAGLPQAGAIER